MKLFLHNVYLRQGGFCRIQPDPDVLGRGCHLHAAGLASLRPGGVCPLLKGCQERDPLVELLRNDHLQEDIGTCLQGAMACINDPQHIDLTDQGLHPNSNLFGIVKEGCTCAAWSQAAGVDKGPAFWIFGFQKSLGAPKGTGTKVQLEIRWKCYRASKYSGLATIEAVEVKGLPLPQGLHQSFGLGSFPLRPPCLEGAGNGSLHCQPAVYQRTWM